MRVKLLKYDSCIISWMRDLVVKTQQAEKKGEHEQKSRRAGLEVPDTNRETCRLKPKTSTSGSEVDAMVQPRFLLACISVSVVNNGNRGATVCPFILLVDS